MHSDGLSGIGVTVLAATVVIAVSGAGSEVTSHGGRIPRAGGFVDAVAVWLGNHLAVDSDRDAASARQLAAGALVLATACSATTTRILVLIINGVVDGDRGIRVGLGVFIGKGLQHRIDTLRRRIGIEGNDQGTAGVGQGADYRGADAQIAAADIHAAVAAAGEAEDIVGIGTAVTVQGEDGAVPVTAGTEEIQLRVGQQSIAIQHNRRGAALRIGGGVVQTGEPRRIIGTGGLQVELFGGGQRTANTWSASLRIGQGRATVALVINGYRKSNRAVRITSAVVGHASSQGGVDSGTRASKRHRCTAVCPRCDQTTWGCECDGARCCGAGNGQGDSKAVILAILLVCTSNTKISVIGNDDRVAFVRRKLVNTPRHRLVAVFTRQGQRRGIVYRQDMNRDCSRAAPSPRIVRAILPVLVAIIDGNGQAVIAVVVGIALVIQRGQGGIKLGFGPCEGDSGTAYHTRTDGSATGHAVVGAVEVERAVGNR